MKKLGSNLFYLIIIVLLSGTIIYLGCDYVKSNHKATPVSIKPTIQEADIDYEEQSDEPVISIDTIQEGVRDLGVLVTQEYYFTKCETYTDSDPFYENFKITKKWVSTKTIQFQYDGKVTAGVDFGKISVETEEDSNIITVHMPEAEIQSIEIDNDSFQLLNEKNGIWNKITMEDYNLAQQKLKEEAKESAIQNNIITNANNNAQMLVNNMILGIVGNEFSIVFE